MKSQDEMEKVIDLVAKLTGEIEGFRKLNEKLKSKNKDLKEINKESWNLIRL